jgi:ATP-dependent protease HslVU (ClpYQ) peptidase subunit
MVTTIAFKDGIMASDSCVTGYGMQEASICKISRTSAGALVGFSGDADTRAILALLDKVKTDKQLPSKQEIAACQTDCALIIAFSPGNAWFVECDEGEGGRFSASVCPANLGFSAVGSGSKLAIGAMLAGKSAREAVAIACKVDSYSKLPVHTLSFEPKKPKPPRPK